MNESINALVNQDCEMKSYFTSGSLTIGNGIGACVSTYTYPYVLSYGCHDKTKAAFAIAKKLLMHKIVKTESIDKFISLVELIEKEL